MLRRQPLVAAPQRHRLRRLQKPLRAIGVFLDFHDPNLVSAKWPTVPPSFGPAAESSMMINRWARRHSREQPGQPRADRVAIQLLRRQAHAARRPIRPG